MKPMDLDPVERFLAVHLPIAAARRKQHDHQLYERFKADFCRCCPDAEPAQYERAMQAIARACGV